MDLRLRFGFAGVKDTDQTCIIVVQVKMPDGKSTQMGLVVDGVEEVVNLAAGDIEETPDFGGKISHRLHPRHGQDQRRGQIPAEH